MNWDIWNVIFVALLIAGIALFVLYLYQPQSPQVLQQYQQDLADNVVVVIYQTDSVEDAKMQFYNDYPDYAIVEVYKGKHGVIIRGRKK